MHIADERVARYRLTIENYLKAFNLTIADIKTEQQAWHLVSGSTIVYDNDYDLMVMNTNDAHLQDMMGRLFPHLTFGGNNDNTA